MESVDRICLTKEFVEVSASVPSRSAIANAARDSRNETEALFVGRQQRYSPVRYANGIGHSVVPVGSIPWQTFCITIWLSNLLIIEVHIFQISPMFNISLG